jgi:histone deacetylase 8
MAGVPGPVTMVVSRQLEKRVSMIEKVGVRPHLVRSLIHSYGLVGPGGATALPLVPASTEELLAFHSRDYVHFLGQVREDEVEGEEFGLGYDCPVLPDMLGWARDVAGGSLTAASSLLAGAAVAINWHGGWHHAHRDSAAGFCYVNDVVLAIHKLQTKFKRVLYVDLDVHHGDGVEEAFSCTDRVATFSIHKFEPGFFPGSGSEGETGHGRGRGYAFNLPLREGLTDSMFVTLFSSVFQPLREAFRPSAVVVQCGADCLARDPMGGFSLTEAGPMAAVLEVQRAGLPLLLLGGGGYQPAAAARLWTAVTAAVLGRKLEQDIPEEDVYFSEYGPDFTLGLGPGCRRNTNTEAEALRLASDMRSRIAGLATPPAC